MTTDDLGTRVQIAGVINACLGTLLILMPWLFQYTHWDIGLTRNSVVVGTVILVCASIRIAHPRSSIAFSVTNIGLGFWMVISSSLLGSASVISGWLSLAVGAALMVCATWSANMTEGSARNRHA